MTSFPDLACFDLIGVDTETTGLSYSDRPIGCSVSTPDGQKWYFSWGAGDRQGRAGPLEMNNCALGDFRAWATEELNHPHITYVMHNAPFDQRMLAYHGITIGPKVEDTQIAASLLDELRPSFSLNDLAYSLDIGVKNDQLLHEWMAKNLLIDGKYPKPNRKSCAPYYWMVPVSIMGPYAEHDPVLTLGVFNKLRPQIRPADLERVYQMETALLPVLLRMHLHGVRADRPRAQALYEELGRELVALEEGWKDRWGSASYRSPDDLKPIFDELNIPYPLTPKTKKASITKDFLEALDHPIGDLIRGLRQISHYKDTFIDGYILKNCTDQDDVLHPEFHALRGERYGAKGGRFSSGGALNIQNVPERDELWGPRIRSLFRPMRDSQVWLKIDHSQIEYRFFAHYADLLGETKGYESAMAQAYIKNPFIDFHAWVAEVAGIPRKRAKNVNFCKLYGGGTAKIAATSGCSLEEAQEFVAAYEEKIPEAKALANDIIGIANRRGYVRTWYGRFCRFQTEAERAARHGTQVERHPDRYAMTHAALNRVLQGSAADLIKLAMIEADKAIDWDRTILHLTVHDELDFSTERDGAEEVQRQLVEIMQDVSRTPAWNGKVMRVPVIAEPKIGSNWGMVEEAA